MSERSTHSLSGRPVHYVIWRAEPGGMESFITAYAAHFAPTRPVFLFSLRPGPNRLVAEPDGYAEGAHGARGLYTSYFRYCRAHRGDQFHLLNSGPVILLLTLLAGVRRPVYHIHGTRYWKSWRDRWALWSAWKLALFFRVEYVANSEYSAMLFRRSAVPIRPHVIYNGFETQALEVNKRRRTHLRRLGYVGRFAPGKNVSLVLQLFNAMAEQFPTLELHFAGTGPQLEALRTEALASPHRRRIIFHGWVKDMPAFYATLDLLVFPSDHESFGNVLAEGLMNGLPVLTSDVPVFTEIHGDPATFSMGSPRDAGSFCARSMAAIGRYDQLAGQAYRSSGGIARKFDMATHLHAIEQCYDRP